MFDLEQRCFFRGEPRMMRIPERFGFKIWSRAAIRTNGVVVRNGDDVDDVDAAAGGRVEFGFFGWRHTGFGDGGGEEFRASLRNAIPETVHSVGAFTIAAIARGSAR